jgi:4-amino-4-deoxy-L-arabinose transferase-like glycosyltransferase
VADAIAAPPRRAWRRLHRRAGTWALLFAVAVSFAGIAQHALWSPDEPREAEIGREMLEHHFSALPTLSGEPFLEKPPLFPWAEAASYALFGVSEGAARLPAALASLLTLGVAWAMGRRAGGRAAGLSAVLVLAGMYEFWAVSHRAVNDALLTAFVAAGHLGFLAGRDALRASDRARANRCWIGVGAASGLALLTKGVVGPLLVLGPPCIAFAFLREWRLLCVAALRAAGWSLVFALALVLPWTIALSRHPGGWGNVRECLLVQTFGRVLGEPEIGAHSHPAWWYLLMLPRSLMPWTIVLPAVVAAGRFARRRRGRRAEFLGALALGGVLLLSIPSGKRPTYLVPLMPAFAAVVGCWLARASFACRIDRLAALACGGLLAVVALALGLGCAAGAIGWIPSTVVATRIAAGHGTPFFAAGAGAFFALGIWALRLQRRAPRGAAPIAARFLPAAAAFTLASHAVVRPLIDPHRALRPAALEVADTVPRSEPLLVLHPSETARGAIPFYSGRLLERVDASDALAAMRRRGAHHLLTQGSDASELPAADRDLLREVRRIVDPFGFDVVVYELPP